jgi:hypothetical protein
MKWRKKEEEIKESEEDIDREQGRGRDREKVIRKIKEERYRKW